MNRINPNDFVEWLITQQNLHGSLYLERVARHYAHYLKTAPPKLDIPMSAEEREVFACTTTAKFDELRNAFLTAPNYKAVNENGHRSFSAGMKVYMRYLDSLERQGEYVKEKEQPKMVERERNDDSAVYAAQGVRTEFRAWLTEQHPDWSSNTTTMHCSDAYYLYNNDRGITLTEALNADDGEQRTLAAIERYFTDNPTQTNTPSVSAGSYLRSLQILKVFLTERYPELLKGGVATASSAVPESIIKVLVEHYANGFRFDTTTLRLLSEKAQVDIDGELHSKLKHLMFRRNDDVYFLPDVICSTETRTKITDFANNWLDDYGCFEISELYDRFINNLNSCCIDSLENFQVFYEFINRRDVRCVEYYRTRIARINRSVRDLSIDIATQIISIAHEEFGGTINEDDLRDRFTAFSANLLASIIKEHAAELVKTEINGMVCYQTLDALGLSDEFSDTLAEVLEQVSGLGLTPSEEVLHTALSINLGVNFKVEYNIPDDKTYRRLIETYYKNAPKRKWLRGIFAEVSD